MTQGVEPWEENVKEGRSFVQVRRVWRFVLVEDNNVTVKMMPEQEGMTKMNSDWVNGVLKSEVVDVGRSG